MTRMVPDTKSDRMVADSTRRRLRRQLLKYLSTGAVDNLLAGKAVDLDVDPKHVKSLQGLMPLVQAYLRGRL